MTGRGHDARVSDLPELVVADASEWRRWLEQNHTAAAGVWLALHKKGGQVTSLTYEQAVQEALCFGWIDGQARARDAGSSLQRMTPRRPRSAWSARNVQRVALLEAEGRMTDAGRAAVEAARADGRWEAAYAGPADAVVPADLAEAIAADPRAQAMFDVLTSANRFALIHRTNEAKRPETRARRIAEFVERLANHQTPYPQKRMPR